MNSIQNEDWQVITSLLPENWEAMAKETKATQVTPKGFKKSTSNMLHTLFMHFGNNYSLRETSARAREAGLSTSSDVGILKAMRRSEEWLHSLCLGLCAENFGCIPEQKINNLTFRLVDGSTVKEPGKKGGLWYLHYSLRLPELVCDYFRLTPAKGNGTGESFKQYPIQENDCIIGDRGYSTAAGVVYVRSCGGHVIVRLNSQGMPLYAKDGSRFPLASKLSEIKECGDFADWDVNIRTKAGEIVSGRICAIKKSRCAIEKELERIRRDASRKGKKIKDETLFYAQYTIVFTTLAKEDFSASEVLSWYRIRWQVELAFKRLKSLEGLGCLPKYDDQSSRAWLYGKLLVGLLTEKLVKFADNFSPWGY